LNRQRRRSTSSVQKAYRPGACGPQRAPMRRNTAISTAVGLILGAASAHTLADAASPESTQASPAGVPQELQEVVVTAQRRNQTTQDIPYNISVLAGDQVDGAGFNNANDLAKIVPGLLVVDSGPAARGNDNSFALRGLRTDNPGSLDFPSQTVSPVSTYFGETPIFLPLLLRDLDHVEVLRGPQGTLYGSGAEAGTIRFIPNRPRFDEFSGEVFADTSKTENSSALNNRFDLILNIPLASQLALRVVGGAEHLAGFIDDVGLAVREGPGLLSPPVARVPNDPTSGFVISAPLRDTNVSDQYYARAALRWNPVSIADFELTYLYQETKVDDGQFSNPNWPGGTQNLASGYTGPIPPFANASYTVPAGGPYKSTALIQQPYSNRVDLGSLVATVDVGFATFTSATSGYETRTMGTQDNTYQWYIPGGTNFLTYYNNYPRTIAVEQNTILGKGFVQELRLVSNGTHTFDYVIGAFFEKQTQDTVQNQWFPGIQQYYAAIGAQSANPQFGDQTLNITMDTKFFDRALFGELTWHITPAWQLTGGMRYYSQSFDVNFSETLPFCGSYCGNSNGAFFVYNAQDKKGPLYKLNTSYDFSSNMKAYLTFSEGFRRGGATGLPEQGIYASLPQYFTYAPDFARNYEVGIKGSTAESRLAYVADLFLVNLDDFQFNSFSPSGLPSVYNGSKARSKGGEVQLTARITSRVTASLAYSYTNASVVEATNIYDLPAFGGPGSTPVLAVSIPEGTRLPGVPKSVVNIAVDYRVPLGSSGWTTDLHADGVYRTSAPGAIPGVYVSGWTMESAKIINAGITFDNGRRLALDIFGTNLTSDPAISGAVGVQGLPLNTLHYVTVTRPRTIGLSARYRF
jgi:iron complex outermembrane recepter protein